MSTSPVVLSWTLRTHGTIERAWEVWSDTDRFNRSANLGFDFSEQTTETGTVIRVGSLQKFGLTIKWHERPFEFERNSWFRSERRFLSGPATHLVASCTFESVEGGTEVNYRVEMYPRNLLTRALLMADARLTIHAPLDRAHRECVTLASSTEPLPDLPPPALTPETTATLQQRLAGLQPPPLADWLLQTIANSPAKEQDRIQPLVTADLLELDRNEVVKGFLNATRRGALELRWELLCPSCRAPKAYGPTFDPSSSSAHCPSCNIQYDGAFADSLAVVFRPAPDIRILQVPIDCLIGPGNTRHIVAQCTIQPGDESALEVDLEPGGYRLLCGPMISPASIRVDHTWGASTAAVKISASDIAPSSLKLTAGTCRVWVKNTSAKEIHVRIEERERKGAVLTAGDLLSQDDARDLLPPDAIAPGVELTTRHGVTIAVELLSNLPENIELIKSMLKSANPRLISVVNATNTDTWSDNPVPVAPDTTVLAVFDEAGPALQLAAQLDGEPLIAVGLAAGPVVVVDRGDQAWPLGESVERAVRALRAVGGGRVGIWLDSLQLPKVVASMRARGDRIGRTGDAEIALVRFAATMARDGPNLVLPRKNAELQGIVDGRYRIDRQIAEGGMGRVYLAHDITTDTPVVLKQLKPNLASDPWHLQQFFAEGRIAHTIRHKNVVRVLDHGASREGSAWIAMEYLNGQELADLIKGSTIDPTEAARLIAEALDGLQAVHDTGVIHRDIKPSNLFVCSDGHVKLIDFGIAKHIDEEDKLANDGIVVGTPHYLAPEQVQFRNIDNRADVYSMGIVLYETLSGIVPFEASTASVVATMRLRVPPRPLPELRPDCPPSVVRVVEQAMQIEREERYLTAEAMSRALQSIVDNDVH